MYYVCRFVCGYVDLANCKKKTNIVKCCIQLNSLNSLDILLFLLTEVNLLITFSSVVSIALAEPGPPAYLYTSATVTLSQPPKITFITSPYFF